MFVAIYKDAGGSICGGVYNGFAKYIADTFSPDCEGLFLWDMKSHGNTYGERKASVQDAAIEWSNVEKPDLSFGELADIQGAFERLGKTYHLLDEFRENAIC